ncbi:MAG TPA: hypothetical protein VE268_03405, partial [Herpetosiphonaceae bacterium]|nr:hypothetical protein [Herpetosiphonaceae bacterium]
MSEESTQVLKMLAEGKLTVEQANQLLEALGDEPAVTTEKRTRPTGRADRMEAPPRFTVEQLIALSEHEVDPNFIKELYEAGLTGLSVEQLIELSEHEVDPSFLKQLNKMGLSGLTFEQIIALSEHEVDPSYLKQLHKEGLTDLTVEQII